jgi:pyridoxamine 5'-phosphate oxidase
VSVRALAVRLSVRVRKAVSVSDRNIPPAASEPLLEDTLGSDPIAAFDRWFTAAGEAGEIMPEAMALATAATDPDGTTWPTWPTVRMVLLRGHSADGFRFFTNHGSTKGRQLAASPTAALLFHWHLPRHRQVRVEGAVARLTDEESAAYFAGRPRGSRISAWASPQSRVVPDRADLERRWRQAQAEVGDDPALPNFWGGYRVFPESVEFWQSGADRLHDRIRFRREADGWARERLAP